MTLSSMLRQHLAAVRALAVLTVVTGVIYPLVVTGIAQTAFADNADGSLIYRDGEVVGSALIGQSFLDADGDPLLRYFQPRPSASGYDTTSTGATNLGPEDIVDTIPVADDPESGRASLLTQVCTRSKAIGEREGVSGARPYCTEGGVGAVLKVFPLTGTPERVVSVNQACPAEPFLDEYRGAAVTCAEPGKDYAAGRTEPIRYASLPPGVAPAVPADAVAASGSGVDPHISPAYAELQAPRVARERGLPERVVFALIVEYTTGRTLGFMGEPAVNVLKLNLALDRLGDG